MKTPFSLLLGALCGLLNVVSLHAQTTAFTYQGRLTASNAPANGHFDFEFNLFGVESGGTSVSGPLALPEVGVTNGIFTVLLDFGAGGFTGADRWLDIAVRPAGGGTFTPLSPRQPITPTPYAVTALFAKQVPGVSGNALHAADGSPQNSVFVDDAGNVGVGTTSPVTRFHVTTSASANPPSPRVESSGTGGFGAGWDFYHGTTGKGYVGVPDSGASFAPGELLLFGGPGTKVSLWPGGVRTLTADTGGNVEVRGDIRLGPNAEFRATSSEENLRIVRGSVNSAGEILRGSGYTVTHSGTGDYLISFTTPFARPPTVIVTAERGENPFPVAAMADAVAPDSFSVLIGDSVNGLRNRGFSFIAIAAR